VQLIFDREGRRDPSCNRPYISNIDRLSSGCFTSACKVCGSKGSTDDKIIFEALIYLVWIQVMRVIAVVWVMVYISLRTNLVDYPLECQGVWVLKAMDYEGLVH